MVPSLWLTPKSAQKKIIIVKDKHLRRQIGDKSAESRRQIGDVTYCDAALKANKLSIVFEDAVAARETLDRVRQFVKDNPTVYLSTHCPEGYENLEMKRVITL